MQTTFKTETYEDEDVKGWAEDSPSNNFASSSTARRQPTFGLSSKNITTSDTKRQPISSYGGLSNYLGMSTPEPIKWKEEKAPVIENKKSDFHAPRDANGKIDTDVFGP